VKENLTNWQTNDVNVLVTGATGFTGIHITKELLNLKFNVYVIARDERKLCSLLGTNRIQGLHLLKGDLLVSCDLERLRTQLSAVARFDAVIHTVGGGPLTANCEFNRSIFDLNYKTTSNLIEILEQSEKLDSLPLFVYFSSLAAMGIPDSSGSRIVYDRTSNCNPVLPYERAKFQTEIFLKETAAHHQFKTVVMRFPQIYGAPDDAFMQMVNLIRKGIFPVIWGHNGSLPLIGVQDVVSATLAVLQNVEKIRQNYTVHLISEGSHSYKELVQFVKKRYGSGGVLSIPYTLMYIAALITEGAFELLGKPEPLNRRRLISLTKDRIVDSREFVNTFGFEFAEDVRRFIAAQAS
jgi:dihydroflavonol-4-reductase